MRRAGAVVVLLLLAGVVVAGVLDAPGWFFWPLLAVYAVALLWWVVADEKARTARREAAERARLAGAGSEERNRCVLELTQEADTCTDPVRALHYREAAECLRDPAGREAVTR